MKAAIGERPLTAKGERMKQMTQAELKKLIELELAQTFGVRADKAMDEQVYNALSRVVKDYTTQKRVEFKEHSRNLKKVYYMSMEFLLGRSLHNHLFNLGLLDKAKKAIDELGFDFERICEVETDAGLGNGGLGRLAACYMDSLTTLGYPASGFSIRYDYGIFAQRIVDNEQVERPDYWLKTGDVWLKERSETYEVKFGGHVEQTLKDGKMVFNHIPQSVILAVPYDMSITGYNSKIINSLRLWSAKSKSELDMNAFARGEYLAAIEEKAMAEAISKVLYPADNHIEGKALRLKQQYFFVSASIQNIIASHLKYNSSLDNLADKVAIHINDTHPALCIPELMRLLLDEHDYSWEQAWDITTKTISYTNHTVMQEALERWPEHLFISLLPRINQIIHEINRRYCNMLFDLYPGEWERIGREAIVAYGEIKMATLCLVASHKVNGVSALHSEILKKDVFNEYYKIAPDKFTNVTNGITYRRWLIEANPRYAGLIAELIGPKFKKDPNELEKLLAFKDDKGVLEKVAEIKRANKEDLAKLIYRRNEVTVDPDSIFDTQIKRIHEYKRQLLNVFNIIDLYLRLKEGKDTDITPRTFIFAGKSAPSYYIAKQIIKLINTVSAFINADKSIRDKIKIVFMENYCVSLAEAIIPATNISEQISIAGKEASGTGNMKFMINGAVTLGTMDGANVEICEQVGEENMFIFGLNAQEAATLAPVYNPYEIYNSDERVAKVIDALASGYFGEDFRDIVKSLLGGASGPYGADSYMVLKDFASYTQAQTLVDKAYKDTSAFNKMALINTAKAGFFSSDRSVEEYAKNIWNLQKYK